jgi:PAS domain S-box-containing protein
VNPDPTKILLVEDSESDADLLQEKLHAGGLGVFEITCATRLDQAIELLRRTTFDAILTDMNLPDSSGKETFLRLREAAPSRPIVVLTGAEDEQLGLEAVRLGMQDYLAKRSADGPQIARAIRYAVERGRTREALRESEARYRMLFESMTEAFVQYEIVFDARQQPGGFRFAEINPAFERLTGLKPVDVIGRVCGEVASAPCFYAADAYRRVATTGEPVRFETFLPALNKHFAASVYRPSPNQLSVIFRDITERKVHEAELQTLNRTLRALSNSNQAMLHATGESAYLQDVCRIIAEDCGHVMVWIGFAEDDAGRTVRPVAHAGLDEGYLEQLSVTWADTERGRGPTGTAIRTGTTVQCADMLKDPAFAPWRAEALKRGYASSLAVPLVAPDRTLGAITIYSRQTAPFTIDEVKLLTELASDVSYGLMALRLRAAHARAEQAAREREEELVAIYENAPVIMLLVNAQRHIQKANKVAERFTGTNVADLLGRSVGDALHCPYAGDDARGCGFGPHCRNCALRQTITHTIETGRSHHELEIAFSTTTAGWQRDNTFLLSTLRLTVRGQLLALATMQNITRRKRTEEALRRAHAELELRVAERTAQLRALAAQLTQSEERERRRIAQILHDDLQQLLVAARLRLETVRGRKDSSPLDQDLQRVQQLINESNDLARGLSHEISPAVLHEFGLVAGLQWLGRWMREKHGFSVRVAAPVPVGPLAADVQVLLFQSVRELLFNAVKHSEVKRASVRLSPIEGGWLEIQVSDKGKGFDPPKNPRGAAGTAGFGLFSIRERLAYLGGHMAVTSAPGQGCQVRLRVPPSEASEGKSAARAEDPPAGRQRADQKPATAPGKSAAQEDPPRPPTKIRVLLADDHRTMRDGLATFLEQQSGIEVVGTASDGQEAIDLVAQLQPDVVIMDVGMPRLDGLEATRRIRSAWPHVQVIGLTMHADESNHAAMRTAGAVDCLIKSGPTEDLLHAIRTAISPTDRMV